MRPSPKVYSTCNIGRAHHGNEYKNSAPGANATNNVVVAPASETQAPPDAARHNETSTATIANASNTVGVSRRQGPR